MSKQKYKVEVLRQNCKELTGYQQEVADGALFNSRRKEMTIDEFKRLIGRFLKKEIM